MSDLEQIEQLSRENKELQERLEKAEEERRSGFCIFCGKTIYRRDSKPMTDEQVDEYIRLFKEHEWECGKSPILARVRELETDLAATKYISEIDTEEGIPPVQMLQILKVLNERRRQEEKWGGADHDDRHDRREWEGILCRMVVEGIMNSGPTDADVVKGLVETAAVAIAWLEAIERRKAAKTE